MSHQDELHNKSKMGRFTIIENHVMDSEDFDIYEKMLYFSLRRFMNSETGAAFPGIKRLAKMSRMSERKAIDAIKGLEERGWIGVERRPNKTSVYSFLDNPRSLGPEHGAPPAQHAGGVVHRMHQGGAQRAHEQDYINKTNKNNSVGQPDKQPSRAGQEIIDHLNEKVGTKFKPTARGTQSLIKARLNEGYTVDDFKTVIDKKTAEWLHDPKMRQYLRPATLFSNKFENYINGLSETPTAPRQTVPAQPVDLDSLYTAGEDY